jgi:hypothetical protein
MKYLIVNHSPTEMQSTEHASYTALSSSVASYEIPNLGAGATTGQAGIVGQDITARLQASITSRDGEMLCDEIALVS